MSVRERLERSGPTLVRYPRGGEGSVVEMEGWYQIIAHTTDAWGNRVYRLYAVTDPSAMTVGQFGIAFDVDVSTNYYGYNLTGVPLGIGQYVKGRMQGNGYVVITTPPRFMGWDIVP